MASSGDKWGPLLGKPAALGEKLLDSISAFRTDGYNGGKFQLFVVSGDDGQQGILFHRINFINSQDHRLSGLAELVQQRLFLPAP